MNHDKQMMGMGWGKFAGAVVTSTVIMFFLMYQLIYSIDHATFSINRLIASLAMGCVMTVVMAGFMWPMLKGRGVKIAVVAVATIAATALLLVNRGQLLVDDTGFMRSMIPHHSIAINNARKANISDPRVRKLADGIIQSQVREIAEMKQLLADIQRDRERGDVKLPAASTELTSGMKAEIQMAIE